MKLRGLKKKRVGGKSDNNKTRVEQTELSVGHIIPKKKKKKKKGKKLPGSKFPAEREKKKNRSGGQDT